MRVVFLSSNLSFRRGNSMGLQQRLTNSAGIAGGLLSEGIYINQLLFNKGMVLMCPNHNEMW